MNEMPKKFILEQSERIEQSPLEKSIASLYTEAREHEDFEVTENLFAAVATFAQILQRSYTKEELESVGAYHALIRSGVPSAHTLQESPHKEEIETALYDFVNEQLEVIHSKPSV